MNKQIEITLPENTINQINQILGQNDLSLFIDQAVNFYITEINKQNLAQQLKAGAINRAKRDLNMAEEWFELEEEIWIKHQQ